MGFVSNLLEYKGKEVHKVKENDSVYAALELLAHRFPVAPQALVKGQGAGLKPAGVAPRLSPI